MASKVDFHLDQKTLKKVRALQSSVEEELPGLINLTGSERQSGLNVGDRSMPFIRKAFEYSEERPEITTSFINVAEFRQMLETLLHLQQLLRDNGQFAEKLEDTHMAIGRVLFRWALAFYNSVQEAARNNVAGTDFIVSDLGERFKKNNSISENNVDPNTKTLEPDTDSAEE